MIRPQAFGACGFVFSVGGKRMLKKFLEAGKIVGTHGIGGELRVNPWCDSAEFLRQFHTLYLEGGDVPVRVLSSRVRKKQLLMTLEGVDTVEKADEYCGKILYLNRDDAHIPQGRYFMEDLIGLGVYDADTFVYYGTLTEIMRTGANDVYRVTSLGKKNYLIPAVSSVIRKIDLKDGKMLIRPIKGIFDDED
jgi:16S rRNA processing protein RimM